MARSVRSGDPDNKEAQAARYYWPKLLGEGFHRNREQPGLNAALNYGYTVLRATVARSVVGSGLVPCLGLHHHNQLNPFCLVDDLLEPFRPLVDKLVQQQREEYQQALLPNGKARLTGLINSPIGVAKEQVSVQNAIQALTHSLVQVFAGELPELVLPQRMEVTKQHALWL